MTETIHVPHSTWYEVAYWRGYSLFNVHYSDGTGHQRVMHPSGACCRIPVLPGFQDDRPSSVDFLRGWVAGIEAAGRELEE